MSRSRRFINGVVLSYAYQFSVMVVGLWLTPFLLRHLGQHDYGLWLVGLQVLSYLMLTDFGIIALLPRSVAYATGRAGGARSAEDLPSIVSNTAAVVLCQTPIVAVVAALIWSFLPQVWSGLRGPVGLVMAGFTILFPFRIFAAVLEGLQEQAFVVRVTMMAWGLSTAVNVISVLSGFGLYSLAFSWLLSQTLTASACAYRVWRHHPGLMPTKLPAMRIPEAISQLGRGFWISINQFGSVLMMGTDVLVISRMAGPTAVVPYSCTGKLATVLSNQPQLLMHLATPGLSEMKTGASKQRLFEVMTALSQAMLLLTGLLFCTILVVNGGFVRWWVGGAQYAGLTLTALILTQMMLRHFGLTLAYTVFCFGYERRLALTVLSDGLVTVGVMLLLVRPFGYAGVVCGSIAGVCLVSLPTYLVTAAHELNLRVSRIAAPLWPWCWRFILVAAGCAVVADRWPPQSVVQIMLAGVSVSLIYGAIMFKAILASPLAPYLRHGIEGLRTEFQRFQVWVATARGESVP